QWITREETSLTDELDGIDETARAKCIASLDGRCGREREHPRRVAGAKTTQGTPGVMKLERDGLEPVGGGAAVAHLHVDLGLLIYVEAQTGPGDTRIRHTSFAKERARLAKATLRAQRNHAEPAI